MKLSGGFNLAYCTNIHRGESWLETFSALQQYTLAVRDRVCPGKRYGIGLRLSDQASRELTDPKAQRQFHQWLDREACYVFTINGFPFGRFHGARVKEQVYAPDWTTRERVDYTKRLFDLLGEFLPPGMEGSVSTVPGSFKDFIQTEAQTAAMRANLWECVEYIEQLSVRSGKELHLGLEPEPLCFLETSVETAAFFDRMRADRPGDGRLQRRLGINYDTCHLAVEFEEARAALTLLTHHGVRISKIHLSSALKVVPNQAGQKALAAFADDIYFHQVIERHPDGRLQRYRDLSLALEAIRKASRPEALEWRIHFHIPLHSAPTGGFAGTTDQLLATLDFLQASPGACSHLEMETYTWEVMPASLKNRSVVDQLVAEYDWTLSQLASRGITPVAGL